MIKVLLRVISGWTIFLIGTLPAIAQFSISGTVYNLNNEPMKAVDIRIKGLKNTQTQTDSTGNFSLINLPQGHYQLEGERQGAFFYG